MSTYNAKFRVGQLVTHLMFSYRGVVYDVDPIFQLSEEWYEATATSRPPKDRPWYHVLVHDGVHTTYVAERNLAADDGAEPVRHPDTEVYFTGFENGIYIGRRRAN